MGLYGLLWPHMGLYGPPWSYLDLPGPALPMSLRLLEGPTCCGKETVLPKVTEALRAATYA